MANDHHLANVAHKQAFDSVDNSNTCVKIGKHCKKAVYIPLSIACKVFGQRLCLLSCQTLTQMEVHKQSSNEIVSYTGGSEPVPVFAFASARWVSGNPWVIPGIRQSRVMP